MTTAFVLSGGVSLGAVQVGMLQALAERGITPDLLVGTSVGAINAAFVADLPGTQGAQRLAKIWGSLRRNDVFPLSARTALRAALRRDHLVSAGPLRHLIAQTLTYHNLEQAAIPLTVVATEVTTGLEVALTRGPAVDALMASAAIPGIFGPVRVGERLLMDGGVTDHTPISHAVRAGADVIYVLPTGYACDLPEPPGDAVGMALHALALLTEQRLIRDVQQYQDQVDLRVMPAPCPCSVAPTDFSRADELIERARAAGVRSLDVPLSGDQTQVLGLHRHHH
ncbi:MAG TPA: patatin-like phospholipase family protein [Candidatus Nanopelagicales bacterium]|jgi:NTE family protein